MGRARSVAVAGLAGTALAFAGLAGTASNAHAICDIPPPSILWSSPAEGAVEVPIDADLLLVTRSVYLNVAQVTLVGGGTERALPAASALPNHFDLGALEPDRDYTVRITQEANTLELHFTTGRVPAPSAAGELLLRSVNRDPEASLPELCSDVLRADTCYDTDPPSLYAFEVDDSPAPVGADTLWLVERMVLDPDPNVDYSLPFRPWPAACGTPMRLDFDLAGHAYRVHNIGEDGLIRASNALAFELPEPAPAPEPEPPRVVTADWRDRGCGLSPSGPRASSASPAWLGVSAAFALALRVRRGRSASRARHAS